MNNFHVEYHTPTSLTRCKNGNDLEKLLLSIQAEGCRISRDGINEAITWSKEAKNGQKHCIGCACTIRKGELMMTEYTSF